MVAKAYSLARLYELSQRDVTVRQAVQCWHSGDVTFEQAMVVLVCSLVERCTRLEAQLLHDLQTAPPTTVTRREVSGGDQ